MHLHKKVHLLCYLKIFWCLFSFQAKWLCLLLSPCHWNQRQYGLSLPKCTTFGNSPLPLGIALDRIAVRCHGSWSQNKSSCFLLYPSPYDAANPNFFSHRWYQCRLSNSPVYMCVISENHTVLLLVLFCNLQTKYQGVEVLFIFVASVHFTSSCRWVRMRAYMLLHPKPDFTQGSLGSSVP